MKRILVVLSLGIFCFTLLLIIFIALANGATASTAILRGMSSAGIILAVCILIFSLLKKNINLEINAVGENFNEEHKYSLEKGSGNSQINQEIINLLKSNPEGATELLRKMAGE